jgi:hypothetical protein
MSFFDRTNRIGSDECNINTVNTQNKSIVDYMLLNTYKTNLKDKDACETKVKTLQDFSTNNHMNIREGYGVTTGCLVDLDSKIRTQDSTSDRTRNQLITRTFTAIPNLARGDTHPEIESKLQQGENTYNVEECQGHHIDSFIPMIPCLKDSIQNPSNIIESWTRGGDATRDTLKQSDFLNKNGYMFDGVAWSKKQCSN